MKILKLKIAPNDIQSMSQDGDAILRSLQNKSLPIIDLLVRESLQNSLDASLAGSMVTKIDFVIEKFFSENLAPHFEMIDDVLIEKYSGEQEFLAISDKNTCGLTGDFRSNDLQVLDNSHFQKLVFGIGKNQDKEGAGGSWGLGKTSYFRIGIGIVIYYTRIKSGDSYEERLIASLIESPKGDRILKQSERGIAWWGEFDTTGKKIYPITDPLKISEILKVFNLSNYTDEETGTMIIIPYLKSMKLDNDAPMKIYPWELDREKAIFTAIQRWYLPRIRNDIYREAEDKPLLECRVNGMEIIPDINMEPVFKIFQKLYNVAISGKSNVSNIRVRAVYIPKNAMKDSKEPVGYIAFAQISREDLKMTPPDNKPSGLAYLGVKETSKIEKNISKVVAYSRKPGMIVEYCVDDGEWMPNGLIQEEDHLLLCFFVPNSNGLLHEKFNEMGYRNLEAYLRSSEGADHARWFDEDGISIIKRIKKYSKKAIQEEFQDSKYNNLAVTSALSRKFGEMLMPPTNFGKTSAKKKIEEKLKRNVTSRNRVSDISVINSFPIGENNIEVIFKAFIKKESTCIVYIQILTQEQKMSEEEWLTTMGENLKFPFEIKDVFLTSVNTHDVKTSIFDKNNKEVTINMNPNRTDCFEITSKISSNIEIEGIIHLNAMSYQFIPSIAIRTKTNKDEGDK